MTSPRRRREGNRRSGPVGLGEAETAAATPRGGGSREPAIELSRARILDRIQGAEELILVRTLGNLGDQLIWAGTRRLLAGTDYREVELTAALRGRGETLLIPGSGGWCGPYHLLAELLPRFEERYARVVVLPSSFDPRVPAVRSALSASRAFFFAREEVSHRQITGLCQCDLAHDAAFFFDFAPYRMEGEGQLDAFRTDVESSRTVALPEGNRDISVACSDLDEWLWAIARHRVVRTDRAHVMIAAALLGKRVEFAASAYHKVPAIAEWALLDRDVSPLASPAPPRVAPRYFREDRVGERAVELGVPVDAPRLLTPSGSPRVTVVVLTRDREIHLERCLASVRRSLGERCSLLVVDDASAPSGDEAVQRLARLANASTLRLDHQGGTAGARSVAVRGVRTEFVFFLDDDAEIFPGTLERLVAAADAAPDLYAVAATVVFPGGRLHVCGGDLWISEGLIGYHLVGFGVDLDDPDRPVGGERRWVNLGATLVRTAALEEHPIDPSMVPYYEDFEWCFRAGRESPPRFLHVADALCLHHHEVKVSSAPSPAQAMRFAPAIARFYERHGLIIETLFSFVPQLRGPGGSPDLVRARLFLELVMSKGAGWMLASWSAGDLEPLLEPGAGTRSQQGPKFPAELAEGAGIVQEHAAALRAELEEERGRLASAAADLAAERSRAAELSTELLRLHGSKWWRFANLYWRTLRYLRSFGRSTP